MDTRYDINNITQSKNGVIYSTWHPEGEFASEQYRADYKRRLEEMMDREWTRNPFVQRIFEAIEIGMPRSYGQISDTLLAWENGSSFEKGLLNGSYGFGWGIAFSVGFLNPRVNRDAAPVGYKVAGVLNHQIKANRLWDVRWMRMKCDGIEKIMTSGRNGSTTIDDVPANYTNIADTIVVTDSPEMLDVLEILQLVKLPKISEHEVFLTLGPGYIENERTDIGAIVEDAKKTGCVIDMRDWIGKGKFVDYEDDPRGHKWSWTGEVPEDVAEDILANHLSRMLGSVKPILRRIGCDGEIGNLSPQKPLSSALDVANALALEDGFITLPKYEAGKRFPSTSGKPTKLSQLMHAGYSFLEADYPVPYKETARRINELQDIIAIWRRELECTGDVVEYKSEDWKDSHLTEVFSKVAKRHGIDDTIATMRAGVPIEDILA